MAHPKRRTSKSKKRKRRTHWKLSAPNLVKCSNCGSMMMPHQVCPECGYYNGRQVVVIEEKEKPKK
ncbi:MAG: 50S ribosomal protein L32 [Candidatus Coatesbacteria bacterium]|nr:MAG: 50S ribosomal protein L32 [Candidatus Coatesbacteria bacterium]RLC42010.1 MAG: 50S ribosomal protein L32 [Candidatus Coatesbacteria bacterium]